ncbi:MAG: hypothetical protein CVV51_10795 [Spirochaetae bacterium HGW-Spirochaetae-7]|nr:MAG: hypothetical protein CVV51_10795 [Spirochaetae bacterium HGW-Spirochaetae-7]
MREPSLNAATAAEFLLRLGEHIDYNINIMDRDGVIIASRDQSRVGSYHDAARRIVANGATIERVEPNSNLSSGVRPGVNLPIVHRSETIGVVGVTGDPDEVMALAYAVKTSVESMLELEAWKEKALRRQDSKNLLMNHILYDDETPRPVVEALAVKLGYDPCLMRAPVLVFPPQSMDTADALQTMKKGSFHGGEDMSFVIPEGGILIFKVVELGHEGIIVRYEDELRAYVESAGAALSRRARSEGGPEGLRIRTYAGAPQIDLGRYRMAYRQVLWLSERYPEPSGSPVFLFDNLLEYLSSRIPREELVAALAVMRNSMPAEMTHGLGPLVGALSDSALNGKEAAARLGVHRNTLASRFMRLSRLLGRDPRHDHHALDYLKMVVRFIELQGEDVSST